MSLTFAISAKWSWKLFLCLAASCFTVLPGTCVFAESVDPILYVDDSAGRLGKINLSTNEVEFIGSLGVTLFDIAFSPTGELFGVNGNGLYSVNPDTAETTYIGGDNYPRSMNALVFGFDGTLYAAGRDSNLYTLDPATGTATVVGPMGFSSAGDLAFDERGDLYLSSTADSLVKVDPFTGAGTEVGPFGFREVLGLARDVDGVMYGYSFTDIFAVDLATGNGTPLLSYPSSGLSQAYGGTFIEEAVVPEPSSVVLALTALVCLIGYAWRMRQTVGTRAHAVVNDPKRRLTE